MPVLRTLGRSTALALLAGRGLLRAGTRTSRFVGRGVLAARSRGGAGEAGMMRMLDLHAASCAGDTLVAIGLAGTVFFNVSPGEARGRVALYLLVTMLPFALLAPVVGPVLDRFRHGRRYALALTMLGRAFLAYMISDHIGGYTLYPAAFGMLVLSRAYGVARSAAVPRILPPGLGLSEAGARASTFGTVAGAIAVPFGLAATALGGAPWPLRLSMVVFVFGMVSALRLPPRADSQPPEVVPRIFHLPGHRGAKVLSGRLVVASLIGSGTLRAAYGFLALFLAFAVRLGDLPTRLLGWTLPAPTAIGLVAGALGVGSFIGTAVGTSLRIRRPALLQAAGILAVTAAAVLAVIGYDLLWVAVLCLVTAIASGLAKLAVDAIIQERVPERVRASAFAHSETLLMFAWVIGGALGLIPMSGRIGLSALAVFLCAGLVRAVLATGRLRRDRLVGAPAADDEPPGEHGDRAVTVDLTGGRPPGPRPGTDASTVRRAPGDATTVRRPADPTTVPMPAAGGGGDARSAQHTDERTPTGRRWRRGRGGPAGTGRDADRASPPEQPTRRDPERPPSRVVTEPEAPPGYHLYRPSGTDQTLDLDDEGRDG